MSTRGCIARLISKPGKKIRFSGSYNHWDSYPSGLGSTLFQLRNGHFKGNTLAMLKYLIDDHPRGWSTINDADFNLPAAPRPDNKTVICKHCPLPNWKHYAQYYVEENALWVEAGRPPCPSHSKGTYLVSDHSPEAENIPHGPVCYEGAEPFVVTQKNASNSGCEYVYAFTPDGKFMVVLSSYCKDGDKMIGMFGKGDKNAQWKIIGEINLDGVEPTEKEWDMLPIEQGKTVEKVEAEEPLAHQLEQAEVTKDVKVEELPTLRVSDLPEHEKKYAKLAGYSGLDKH